MYDTAKRNSPIFRLLTTSKKARRKKLIDLLSRSEVDNLCEVILNGIAGEPRHLLNSECLAHCRRYKKVLRELAYKGSLCWKRRKDVLREQSGRGWFVPLIDTVLDAM